jgi:N utilization substance protein B
MKENQKLQVNVKLSNKPTATIRKSAARLAAIQAIYSRDMDDYSKSPALLTLDVIGYYNDQNIDDEQLIIPDEKFLARVIDSTIKNIEDLDQIISEFLSDNWSLDKINPVIKAILRCAICEIKYMYDVPAKVIINEYTTLAKSFYGNKEIGFVNSILDKISTNIREQEFKVE